MKISNHTVVAFNYEVKELASGDVVDSNVGSQPLEFIVGKSQIIPGLEKQMLGMESGESADIMVKHDEAYGPYNEEAMQQLPKEQFAGIDLQAGMTLYGQGEDGQTVQVSVKEFNDESVTIDFNHPLAGKDLMFSISVGDVREATADEALSGELQSKSHGGGSCGSGCGCH